MNSIIQPIIQGARVTAQCAARPLSLIAAVVLALAAPALAADTAPTNYFRMKLAKIVDAHGFEQPLTAATLLIPTDWTLHSEVTFSGGPNLVKMTFRASSPDGRTAVELFPGEFWNWSSDPNSVQLMEKARQDQARFGGQTAEIGPPLAARDYLSKRLLPRSRPGARLIAADVVPESVLSLSNSVRQAQEQMLKYGIRARLQADTARLRIAYDRQGQAQEEWLTGVTTARGTPAPTYNIRTGQQGQAISYACGAERLFGFSAPAGRLDPNEKLFRTIVRSFQVDPNWQGRVQQVQANIANMQSQSALKRSQIAQKSFEDTQKIINDTYKNRQESQDRINERWSEVNRGVETFRNPSTGENVQLSTLDDHAWSNGKGEYIVTDSSSLNPNTGSKDNWTRLQRVEPGKPPQD